MVHVSTADTILFIQLTGIIYLELSDISDKFNTQTLPRIA